MLEYICPCKKETKQLAKATIKIIEGKIVTAEAICSCNKYMKEIESDFNGFPSLIRTEPTLTKKRDKLWDSAKEKLIGKRGINESFK
tara:strand:- start:277 stop:537 length:261 start_codon:yes stop_codon:yes gene_type:complete